MSSLAAVVYCYSVVSSKGFPKGSWSFIYLSLSSYSVLTRPKTYQCILVQLIFSNFQAYAIGSEL